jgi:hypothetical protein
MVDEELVQVGNGAHPPDAEESGRRARADSHDEPLELSLLGQLRPASLGESLERAGEDETGSGDEVMFTQHKVGGKVLGGPAVEQRGCVGSEFFK